PQLLELATTPMRPWGPPRAALVLAPNSPGDKLVARPDANAPWAPPLFVAPMQLACGDGSLAFAHAVAFMPSARAAQAASVAVSRFISPLLSSDSVCRESNAGGVGS